MKRNSNSVQTAAVTLCAVLSALSAGCFTSRTSLFGNYPGAGSPRATGSSTTSEVAPARVRRPAQTPPAAAPRSYSAPQTAPHRPAQPVSTPHGTVIPAPRATYQPPTRPAAPIVHSAPAIHPAPAIQKAPAAPGWREHVVQPGEVVGRLANDNGMTIAEFCEVNGIKDPNRLQVGQRVKIATGRQSLGPGRHTATPSTASGHASASGSHSTSAPAVRTPAAPPPPPKKETTGSTTTDVDALLRGGSLAAQREAASEQAAKAAAQAAAEAKAREEQAKKAAAEEKAKADAEAARLKKAAEEESRRLADVARAEAEKLRLAAEEQASAAKKSVENLVQVTPAPKGNDDGFYTVAAGDDIYSISLKFETTPLELRRLNGGKSLTGLQPGDRIAVPKARE